MNFQQSYSGSFRSRSKTRGGFRGLGLALLAQACVICSALVLGNYLLDPLASRNHSQPNIEVADLWSAGAINSPDFGSEERLQPASLTREVSYQVKSGDTFSSIWLSMGASTLGAAKAAEAVHSAGIATLKLKKGEELQLVLSNIADEVLSLKKHLDDGSTLLIQGNLSNGYEATVLQANIVEEERNVVGTILSSFAASALDREVPYAVVDDFVDLFGGRVEFSKSLQPGDSFTISFVERKCADTGKVLWTGPIIEASIKTGGKLMAAVRRQAKSGQFVYYNEQGQQMGAGFLRYPLQFTKITSTFSWARFHPILQRTRPHYGVDFAAPIGTPVRSVADGKIDDIGFKAEPGNWIKIIHSDRYSTAYMHLSAFSPGLHRGSHVSRGQVIGFVGHSGLATGPHLHFSLYDHGVYTDPLKADLPNLVDDSFQLPKSQIQMVMDNLVRQHDMIQMASVISPLKRQG